MELKKLIRCIELFDGLTDSEIDKIAALCEQRHFKKGDLLAIEGETGEELFIVMEGFAEILVKEGDGSQRVLVNLGSGQIIGEMSLVDRGPRSATVRAINNPTIVQVIRYEDFHKLCEQNTRIGYIVMLNMAADLSFKLRHQHLS